MSVSLDPELIRRIKADAKLDLATMDYGMSVILQKDRTNDYVIGSVKENSGKIWSFNVLIYPGENKATVYNTSSWSMNDPFYHQLQELVFRALKNHYYEEAAPLEPMPQVSVDVIPSDLEWDL